MVGKTERHEHHHKGTAPARREFCTMAAAISLAGRPAQEKIGSFAL